MSLLYNCVICGNLILHRRESLSSWLGEFRGIYSNSSGTFISGVGRFGVNGVASWIAPEDPDQRWNDYKSKPIQWISPPVMLHSPGNDDCGFAVHDACWCLLQRACQPHEVSLQRLISVCMSLPRPRGTKSLSWGHDYGELWTLDDRNFYPWEERLREHHPNMEIASCAYEDPYIVPEIPMLLTTRLEINQGMVPVSQHSDRFSTLPWEILESIAIDLPTHDALNLRLVSSAFYPLYVSRQFWASRFEANQDREFVFETRDSRDSIDWMVLYKLTASSIGPTGLRNRRRIWDLLKPIKDLANLRETDSSGRLESDQIQCSQWHVVTGDIKDEEALDSSTPGFCQGCRMFRTHCAHVPNDLAEIRFTVSTVGQTDYISGIRLLTESGTSTCLGYLYEDKEIRCKVTSLKGFITATGEKGINALKVVHGDGKTSGWIGRPSNMPVTDHLARFNPITALKVGSDGFKIVSLAVADYSSVPAAMPEDQTLREAALWYPEVPDSGLCLNEDSLVGIGRGKRAYEPIAWIHFGGPGGSRLPKLTGISVDIHNRLSSLEVHCDPDHAVVGEYKLGRCEVPLNKKLIYFAIDGACGEFIERVEAAFDGPSYAGKLGSFNALKITTNHKRTFHAGASEDFGSMQLLKIAPGTTLTGFYASKHPLFGFQILGVISEKIVNSTSTIGT